MFGSRVDGSLRFDTRVDSGGFNTGIKNLGSSLGRLRNSLFKVASAVGVAFSVTAVVSFGKTCIDTATEVENAWVGLNSIINGQGKSFDNAKKFIKEYVSDGLVPLNNAVTAYKNLSLRGYNEEQIQAVMNSLKNSATYARQSQYTLGDAVSTATEGLKNENSILVDNAGVTKNVAQMWKEYAKSIGVSYTSLTKEQKIQAEVNGILEETKFQMGDASKYTNTYSGQIARLSAVFTNLKTKIGNILKVIAGAFLPVINLAISEIDKLADKVTSLFNSWGIQTDVVDTLNGITDVATDSTDSLTDSIDETAEATKELNNQLASFDKLNVLSKDDSDSDISSAGSTTATQIPSTAVNQANTGLTATEKILDKIINRLKAIGSTLGFDDVNWSTIKGNIDSIFKDLEPIAESAFNGAEKVAKSSIDTINKFASGVVKVAGKSLETVTGGVSKWLDEDKTKIVTGITEISDNISGGIDNIGTFYDSIFDTLGGSMDRMRPTMESAIATLLGGYSDLGLSIGNILSNAFNIATENISTWAINNQTTIGTFFDNIQSTFIQISEFLGGVMTDISDILTGWWYNGGAVIFDEVCRAFTDIGTTVMNVYNQWIQPAIDCIIGIFSDCWEYTLKPIFERVVSFVGKMGEYLSALWGNILLPIVNWFINYLAPTLKHGLNTIKGVFETVFKVIGDIISGFLKAIGGVIDFLTGVFKGDWKKAWHGVFDILEGVWQMIWGCIKGVVNLIIDGINALVGGIYTVFATIANVIGEAAGVIGDVFGQDWSFSMPTEWTPVPKLATGTVVPANYGEFAAILGDNKREPEIVSPLSTMKQAMREVLEEMNVMGGNGNIEYRFVAELNGKPIFEEVVTQDKIDRKRHGGKSRLGTER